MFETEKDVLGWYESQPRALSAEFLRGINRAEAERGGGEPSLKAAANN